MTRKKVELVGRESLADAVRPRGAGSFKDRVVGEAKAAGIPIADDAPAADVPAKGLESVPAAPESVRNGQMFAHYLVPVYSENTKGAKFVAMRMSFPLTAKHHDLLPEEVTDSWDFMTRGDVKLISVENVPDQNVEIRLAPDDSNILLSIASAAIHKAMITKVKDTGKGKATEYFRFSFELSSEIETTLCKWADRNFGGDFWLKFIGSQRKLR